MRQSATNGARQRRKIPHRGHVSMNCLLYIVRRDYGFVSRASCQLRSLKSAGNGLVALRRKTPSRPIGVTTLVAVYALSRA